MTKQMIQEMIDRLLDLGSLSTWEVTFVNEIARALQRGIMPGPAAQMQLRKMVDEKL